MNHLASRSRQPLRPGSDGAKPVPAAATGYPTLLLAAELFRAEGGIARVARLYLRALSEAGGPVDLVVLNDDGLPPAALARYAPRSPRSVHACGRSQTAFIFATARAARQVDRVVCVHARQLPAAWLARLINRRLRIAVVLHGIEVWQGLPALAAAALRRIDRAYCVSDYTRRRVAERYPAIAPRCLVVPNALDPDWGLRNCAADTVAGAVLAVSRLDRHDHAKGLDHLIEGWGQVRAVAPRAQLRLVGDGPDRTRLEALAAASPGRAGIHFLGRLPEEALRREFAACQVFALPSAKEGFGLVYLEAMALGKPCIGARAGGVPEVIAPGCGTLVEYGDRSALAAAVVDALRAPWDSNGIVAHAATFSYQPWAARLHARWAEGLT